MQDIFKTKGLMQSGQGYCYRILFQANGLLKSLTKHLKTVGVGCIISVLCLVLMRYTFDNLEFSFGN